MEDWEQLVLSLKYRCAFGFGVIAPVTARDSIPPPKIAMPGFFSFTHELKHLYLQCHINVELICSVSFDWTARLIRSKQPA
jgi:hypothetical protein